MNRTQSPGRVTLEGVGARTLRTSDYVTEGGEGMIYRTGDRIIKLYHQLPPHELKEKEEKIALLRRTLDHPSIVTPSGLVTTDSGVVIGYHMPYIAGESLPPLFTNDVWHDRGITTPTITALAAHMHGVMRYTHERNVLMVDPNELNWLVHLNPIETPIPFAIDVDAWQIGRFKATVVMPSIRDWHRGVSKESDWFAWGIVTFLLYTGIHPYKGTLAGYKPGELERRMKDNASVFVRGVRLNRAVRDFKTIPGPLLDWYNATFTGGERGEPPSPLARGTAHPSLGTVLHVTTAAAGSLVFEKLFEIPGDPVISLWQNGIVRTSTGKLIELATKRTIGTVTGTRVSVVERESGWFVTSYNNNVWEWQWLGKNGTQVPLTLPFTPTHVLRSGERLFAITETELIELTLIQLTTPILAPGRRWQILGASTTWWSEIGVSNMLGAMHLIVPFGTDAVAQVRTPALDRLHVVNARAGTRVAYVVTLDARGEYTLHEYAFDASYKQYVHRSTPTDSPELNLTTLDKGVVAAIGRDGLLTVSVPHQGTRTEVADAHITTDMLLGHIGDRVVYRHHGALWTVRMQ